MCDDCPHRAAEQPCDVEYNGVLVSQHHCHRNTLVPCRGMAKTSFLVKNGVPLSGDLLKITGVFDERMPRYPLELKD